MVHIIIWKVGYGDFSPQTTVGRTLTGFAMVAGLLVISMPLAIVGNNFTEVRVTAVSVVTPLAITGPLAAQASPRYHRSHHRSHHWSSLSHYRVITKSSPKFHHHPIPNHLPLWPNQPINQSPNHPITQSPNHRPRRPARRAGVGSTNAHAHR